ncbi:MAG TPA: TonB-dependent receptor [Candidatus Acidoferrales bacterium]|nr:TonB-dependent receptor [Candidatus Acidoferrales bacterium]
MVKICLPHDRLRRPEKNRHESKRQNRKLVRRHTAKAPRGTNASSGKVRAERSRTTRIEMINAFLVAANALISGTVVDQRGQPVSRAHVIVSRGAGPALARESTSAKGTFRVSVSEAGSYRLRVEATSFRTATVDAAAPASRIRIVLQPSALRLIGSVTGRPRTPFNATPAAQKIFPREAYRDQAQPSLSSVLDQTPGTYTTRDANVNAGVPVAPSLASVRGGLPYETAVTIDGSPLALPSTGTFDLSLIPTFELGDVEILKGPGDISGSGGSVGGAINLRTAEPTARITALPEVEGDSVGGQFSDLAYDGTLSGGKISFASMVSIDGSPGTSSSYDYSVGGHCCTTIPADELRRALLLDLRETPSPAWSITETMLAVNVDRSLAGTEGAQLGESTAVSLAPALDALEADRLRFQTIQGQYGDGDDTFSARLFNLDLARDLGSSVFGGSAYDRDDGGALSWTHAIAQNRYALEIDDSNAAASSTDIYATPILAGSQTDALRERATANLQLSSRDEADLSAETETLSSRYAPFGSTLVQRSWSPANARAGYSHILLPGLALRASVGTSGVPAPLGVLSGYAPALEQYVGLPARVVSTESDVSALERANGSDVGLEWQLHGQATTLSFDLYQSHTQDAYVEETSTTGPASMLQRWFNGPPMIDEGAEISIVQFKRVGLGFIAQMSLPRTYVKGSLPPSFYASGNLAVLPNQNISGGAFYTAGENDVSPTHVPYAQGYGEISYKWPRGSRASIGILYFGSNNAYGRDAFETVNANIEVSAGDRGKFQFSIENLTGALDNPLPLAFGGVGVPLATGGVGLTNANVLAPRTLRFMFRQSIGNGSLFEH